MHTPVIGNHTQLLDRLEIEIAAITGHGMQLAVLILKMDGMAKMDGLMGYRSVDRLARQMAERLREALRDKDILAQLGRDEFCVILPDIFGEGQAVLAANKIQRVLERPFDVDSRQVYASPRLGISLYPEHSDSAEQLLKQSKVASQEAIARKDVFAIYDQTHDLANRLQFDLESDLRKALANGELELWYQPQLDLKSGQIIGSEALLRWANGPMGYVSPSLIVPVAERSGLITLLTTWVLNTALRQWGAFREAGLDLTMGINFSAHNLLEPELPESMEQALRTWNVPADRVVVEITESAMMGDQMTSIETLKRLKKIGVKLALDDFGTGYSSMSHVRMTPLDELKIDLSFVKNMLQFEEDEKIVRAIIELGHNFGLSVIAEGVEDKQTADALDMLGCDRIQGYFISPPVPAEKFKKLILKQ